MQIYKNIITMVINYRVNSILNQFIDIITHNAGLTFILYFSHRKKSNMDITFNKSEDHNKLLLSNLNKMFHRVSKGGGDDKLIKHRKKGKMSARERIEFLFDKDSDSIEIGAFAGHQLYDEHGGCPSGGVFSHLATMGPSRCPDNLLEQLFVSHDGAKSD